MNAVAQAPNTINERIFELLRNNGVTEQKLRPTLAKVCGVSLQAVHQWSTAKSYRAEYLLAIAQEYHTTIEWILTGLGPRIQSDTVLEPRKNQQEALALVEKSKNAIRQLSESLETTNTATAYKLLQVAMDMEKIKDALR